MMSQSGNLNFAKKKKEPYLDGCLGVEPRTAFKESFGLVRGKISKKKSLTPWMPG
jgi:hypothetical protein